MTSTLGDRLVWTDGDLRMSQCVVCRHKSADATCSAFPAGIPKAVLRNEISHADPMEGDQGVRLEPIEIAAELFEHITGLAWPALSVSHDVLDALIKRAHASGELDATLAAALLCADLLLPRVPGNPEEGLLITTIADAQGNPHVPLFTSIPHLEAFCGAGTARVRLAISNLTDGFPSIPIVLNPGSGAELTFDPVDLLQRGAS